MIHFKCPRGFSKASAFYRNTPSSLMVGGLGGLFHLDLANMGSFNKEQLFYAPKDFVIIKIEPFILNPHDMLYLITHERGLMLFDGKNKLFKDFNLIKDDTTKSYSTIE